MIIISIITLVFLTTRSRGRFIWWPLLAGRHVSPPECQRRELQDQQGPALCAGQQGRLHPRQLIFLLRWSPPIHLQRHFLSLRRGMLLRWLDARMLTRPHFLVVTRQPTKSTSQQQHHSLPRLSHLGHSLETWLLVSLHPRVVPLECLPPVAGPCTPDAAAAAARGTARSPFSLVISAKHVDTQIQLTSQSWFLRKLAPDSAR